MKLVRFGKRTINMDQVVEIEHRLTDKYGPECYRLYTMQVVDGSPNWIELDGADVIAFEQWLTDNSDNARAPMETEE